MIVRPVITTAVSTRRPEVRRPVSARYASAAYDQPRAARIAVQTFATAKQT
jgi:hypothetical protein